MRRGLSSILGAVLLPFLAGCGSDARSVPEGPGAPGEVPPHVTEGGWGGNHAAAAVSSAGAQFTFECGHGVASSPLYVDPSGHFSVSGTYFIDRGLIIVGDPRQYPARFSGTVTNGVMQLEVSYIAFGGAPQDPRFELTIGQPPHWDQFCPST